MIPLANATVSPPSLTHPSERLRFLLPSPTPGSYSRLLLPSPTPGSYSRLLLPSSTPGSYSRLLLPSPTPGSYSRLLLPAPSPNSLPGRDEQIPKSAAQGRGRAIVGKREIDPLPLPPPVTKGSIDLLGQSLFSASTVSPFFTIKTFRPLFEATDGFGFPRDVPC
jgi:hypothetical protein